MIELIRPQKAEGFGTWDGLRQMWLGAMEGASRLAERDDSRLWNKIRNSIVNLIIENDIPKDTKIRVEETPMHLRSPYNPFQRCRDGLD